MAHFFCFFKCFNNLIHENEEYLGADTFITYDPGSKSLQYSPLAVVKISWLMLLITIFAPSIVLLLSPVTTP